MNKPTTNPQKSRFNYLKSMFRQAPLSEAETKELLDLAKKFSPKLAECIEASL